MYVSSDWANSIQPSSPNKLYLKSPNSIGVTQQTLALSEDRKTRPLVPGCQRHLATDPWPCLKIASPWRWETICIVRGRALASSVDFGSLRPRASIPTALGRRGFAWSLTVSPRCGPCFAVSWPSEGPTCPKCDPKMESMGTSGCCSGLLRSSSCCVLP